MKKLMVLSLVLGTITAANATTSSLSANAYVYIDNYTYLQGYDVEGPHAAISEGGSLSSAAGSTLKATSTLQSTAAYGYLSASINLLSNVPPSAEIVCGGGSISEPAASFNDTLTISSVAYTDFWNHPALPKGAPVTIKLIMVLEADPDSGGKTSLYDVYGSYRGELSYSSVGPYPGQVATGSGYTVSATPVLGIDRILTRVLVVKCWVGGTVDLTSDLYQIGFDQVQAGADSGESFNVSYSGNVSTVVQTPNRGIIFRSNSGTQY